MGHLERAGRDLEPRLAQSMQGFTGMFVKAYLPQRWVFETESEVVHLTVDPTGRFAAGAGALPSPDVTVSTTHDRLEAALRTRDPAKVPKGPMKVTPHTAKGKAAYEFLRGRLGL